MKRISTSPRRSRLAVATALLLLAGAGRAGGETTPRAIVVGLSDDVIAVLKQTGLTKAEKRQRVEDIAVRQMDFETLARLTMARNWARLSPAQQQEFLREFRRHLSATYGRRLDDYRNETVSVTGERAEARGDHTVKTRIDRGGGTADVLVDYRLRRTGGEWRIIDVVIEGVSLVANFRSQFQEMMERGGPDHLLASLRRKTAEEEQVRNGS